jgi:hypothetical protein
MLTGKAMWFPCAANLDDPYEGHVSSESLSAYAAKELRQVSPPGDDLIKNFLSKIKTAAQETRKGIFVNCWHIADEESAAMWKVYAPAGQGIAIKTTAGMLKQCFRLAPESIFLSPVAYSKHVFQLDNGRRHPD